MSRIAKPNRRSRARRRLGALALLGVMVVMIVLAAPAGAQDAPAPLGRLFFTPEQRSALDRQRQLSRNARVQLSADPALTINGVALRSSGKRTVWINGVAHDETPDGVAVVTPNRRDPGQVVVHTTGAAAVKARVGDTVDGNSGEASGVLGSGSLTIRRGAPAGASH